MILLAQQADTQAQADDNAVRCSSCMMLLSVPRVHVRVFVCMCVRVCACPSSYLAACGPITSSLTTDTGLNFEDHERVC